MRGKKSTLITTLAVIISVLSLVSAFGVLGITNSVQGVSIEEKKIWKIEINDLSKLAMDEGAIEVIKEPSCNKFKLSYGLKLINVGNSQFEFTIKNDGNIDAIVNNIKINGIDEYKDYLNITINELKIGDVIKGNSFIQVKVITEYKKQLIDENMIPQLINLDNIEIDIDLKKIE